MRDLWLYLQVKLEDWCKDWLWDVPSETDRPSRVGRITKRVMIHGVFGGWLPRFPDTGSSWVHRSGRFRAAVIGVYVPNNQISTWDMPEVLYEDQFNNLCIMPIYCWDKHFKPIVHRMAG